MFFIKLFLIIFLLISCCIKNKCINRLSITLCIYFLFRWITDYRKCTISYLECKLRGVRKEKGIIYNILEPLYDINKTNHRYLIYIIVIIILLINKYNYKNISYY